MPITVPPTLFVGFGGSGSKVLKKIKESLSDVLKRSFPNAEANKQNEYLPPCFQFLEVDIDEDDAKERGFKETTPQFLGCNPRAGFDQLDARIERGRGQYEFIKPWWPKGLGHAIIENNPGAEMDEGYRLRQLGKLALWLKVEELKKSKIQKYQKSNRPKAAQWPRLDSSI